MTLQNDFDDDENTLESGILGLLIAVLILAVGLALSGEAEAYQSGTDFEDRVQEVSGVMFEILGDAPRRRLYTDHEERFDFSEDIVAASDASKIPEFLLTVQIYRESSFRMNARATDRPTIGLGQIYEGGVASHRCDMSTRIGQLSCSARFLRVCWDKCGTWKGALTAYATAGYCSSSKAKVNSSVNSRLRMWDRFERQRERVRIETLDDMEHYADLKEQEHGE